MTTEPHTPALVETLREVAAATDRLPDAAGSDTRALARRVRTRILRDLLPRLSSEAPLLLVAIAGPNNVGKSTLFNALVAAAPLAGARRGRPHASSASPRRPGDRGRAGCEALSAPLRGRARCHPGRGRRWTEPGPPGRLYLALGPHAAAGPAGDGHAGLRQRRTARTGERTEALLVTVDVVVFVVSPAHVPERRAGGLPARGGGPRSPYLLVYNEAPRAEVARAHLDKLAADVGASAACALPAARTSPRWNPGRRRLPVEPLDGGPALAALLADPERSALRLKARALAASLADARAELEELAAQVACAGRSEPERLRARLRHELAEVGARARAQGRARRTSCVEAFRDELDARSAFHRWIRLPFRGLATALDVRRAQAARSPSPAATPEAAPVGCRADGRDAARRRAAAGGVARAPRWPPGAATRRPARRWRRRLARRPSRRWHGRAAGLRGLCARGRTGHSLYALCRELVGAELPGRMRGAAIQALTTLVYSVPAGAAAVVTVATGGHWA